MTIPNELLTAAKLLRGKFSSTYAKYGNLDLQLIVWKGGLVSDNAHAQVSSAVLSALGVAGNPGGSVNLGGTGIVIFSGNARLYGAGSVNVRVNKKEAEGFQCIFYSHHTDPSANEAAVAYFRELAHESGALLFSSGLSKLAAGEKPLIVWLSTIITFLSESRWFERLSISADIFIGQLVTSPKIEDPVMHTVTEVAKYIGVSPRTVRDWRKQGRLTVSEGESDELLFSKSELDRYHYIKEKSQSKKGHVDERV